jgi:hypothetical protein
LGLQHSDFVRSNLLFRGRTAPGYTLDHQEDSPQGDIVIEYYSNPDGKHQIWLAPKSDLNNRVELFEFDRDATVLMAPNEEKLVIITFRRAAAAVLAYTSGLPVCNFRRWPTRKSARRHSSFLFVKLICHRGSEMLSTISGPWHFAGPKIPARCF